MTGRDAMKKTIHFIWAGLVLFSAVFVVASLTSSFMIFIAFPIGVPMAVAGSAHWFSVWLWFDKFMNVIIGGYAGETVSSALGKSVYFECEPVFFSRRIDKTVNWLLHQVDPNHCRKSIDWDVGESEAVGFTEPERKAA